MTMPSRDTRQSSLSTLWRLLRLARPYWSLLTLILLVNLLSPPLALLAPLPMKIVIDNVVQEAPPEAWLARILPEGAVASSRSLLLVAVGLMVSIGVISQLRSMVSGLLRAYAGEKLLLRFREMLFQHMQRLSFTYHDQRGAADSTYRIQSDANSIQHVFIDTAIPLVTSALTVVGMIYVTARIDVVLMMIALIVVPIMAALIRIFGSTLKKKWRLVSRLDSASMSVVQETLSSLRVVRAFGTEGSEHQRFLGHANRKMRGRMDATRVQLVFGSLTGLTITVTTAAIVLVGTLHVLQGTLTLGELTVVVAYIGQILGPIRRVTEGSGALSKSLAQAERAFDVLDEEPDVVDLPGARPLDRARGAIAFENVAFSYRKGEAVLSGVSFQVEPGSRVGIRGRTGAGKTTLAGLMMRFYDIDRGRILLDGVDIRDYRIEDLRRQFALVLQEPVLFSVSIRENIAYAKPDATEEEIVAAARLANAHDFISALPDGYETEVGERGMMLSGGERQRVALARAFLKDAPMLILDEPTSSVDTRTEEVIVEAMERLMTGRTTFMIAHRLTTLESCHIQLELEGGKLRVLPGGSTPPSAQRVLIDSR